MSKDKVEFDTIVSTQTWEFDTDQIRLSSLSNARLIQAFQERFFFTEGGVTQPSIRGVELYFGSPPGVEFRYGLAPVSLSDESDEVEEIAFRQLSIDANHVSVEVAGSSSYADEVFHFVAFFLSESKTPDGKPFIGTWKSVKSHSLISIRKAEWQLSSLARPGLRGLVGGALGIEVEGTGPARIEIDAPGYPSPFWLLKPRLNTEKHENIIESGAWVRSEEHVLMLTALDEFLTT